MKDIAEYIRNLHLAIPEDRIIIGDDLVIMHHTNFDFINQVPMKLSNAVISVCISGHCRIKINLEEHDIDSPMLITMMPGQIFEPMESSNNFQCYTITLSKRFVDMINLPGWQQHYMVMYNNPITRLDAENLQALHVFYFILHRAASDVDNPFRLQVIENLIRVFYYGGLSPHRAESATSNYKNSIVERFMELVHDNFREERMIGYYADKLCITPKYLSKIVKENTGRSAGEWIENHVILEARAMLQSSDMTIQQIAASLNFPNQSFFGKYFKRATGLSPKQYRHSGNK